MNEELNGGIPDGGISGGEGNAGGAAGTTDPAPAGTENPSAGDGVAPAGAREGASPASGPENMDTSRERSNDWRSRLPEGWADKLADKLKDVKDADEAMKALERGLGYRPAQKPEDIALRYPESFTGAVDEGVENNFREFCVREGITPGQAQALLDWQLGANREILDKIIEDGTKALREAWGSRFEENRDTALKAFSALDRRMNGELSGSIAGRNMANDPAFVRAFHEIGKLLSEDALSGGVGATPSDGRESAEDTYKDMFKG